MKCIKLNIMYVIKGQISINNQKSTKTRIFCPEIRISEHFEQGHRARLIVIPNQNERLIEHRLGTPLLILDRDIIEND